MINITKTEQRIATLIDPILITTKYGVPAYKIREFPGSLDDLGKVVQCEHVVIQFKNIAYDETSMMKMRQPCIGQINWVYFELLVQSNNLRSHRNVYDIATAIIEELRGCMMLVQRDNALIQGQSPAEISSYSFGTISNGGACYQSTIEIKAQFTDTYLTKSA